nr:MAG TPA: hypothetical protein [Bacteriophage sp.]
MSLAFAISLNVEGQFNVAVSIARAIEVSIGKLDSVIAISSCQEGAQWAGCGRSGYTHINLPTKRNGACIRAKIYRDITTLHAITSKVVTSTDLANFIWLCCGRIRTDVNTNHYGCGIRCLDRHEFTCGELPGKAIGTECFSAIQRLRFNRQILRT